MKLTSFPDCCAAVLIHGFANHDSDIPVPSEKELASVLTKIQSSSDGHGPAYVIFTDSDECADDDSKSAGDRLSEYIRSHALGEVYETKEVENPSSGNNVKVYIWVPNDNLQDFEISVAKPEPVAKLVTPTKPRKRAAKVAASDQTDW